MVSLLMEWDADLSISVVTEDEKDLQNGCNCLDAAIDNQHRYVKSRTLHAVTECVFVCADFQECGQITDRISKLGISYAQCHCESSDVVSGHSDAQIDSENAGLVLLQYYCLCKCFIQPSLWSV